MAQQWPPKKNTAFTVVFPIRGSDGQPVTGVAGLDSERSIDGAAFADCTNEATEIGTTGFYSLALSAGDMNGDYITVQVKSTSYPTVGFFFSTVASTWDELDNLIDDLESRIGTPSDLGGGATIAANLSDIEAQTDDIGAAGAGLTALATQASVNTIDDFLDTEIAAIKAKTDSLTFTVANQVDANAVAVSGDATAADNLESEYDGTGYGHILQRTTIATLASQTSFTLTAGSADNDAYNGCIIVIQDATTAAQKAVGVILDYTGATKTVTLLNDPAVFTMATTDIVTIIADRAVKPTVDNRTLDVSTGGEAGLDWANIGSPTTAQNLSATNIDVDQVVASVSGAVGSVTGAVGSVAAGGITAASIATGAIDADALAADAVAEIADGVWDEDATGHQTQGTFGQAIGDPAADATTIYAAVITNAAGADISADILTIDNLVDDLESRLGTPANLGSGATVAANLVDIEAQTDDIGVAGAGLTAVPWNAAWDAEVQSEVDDALVAQRLDELLNADSDIDGAAPPTVGSVFHELMSKTAGAFSFDQTTDSLEAVRDKAAEIEADTQDLQSRVPAALVGGRMDSDVAVIQANAVSAAALATDAVAEIADGVWDEALSGHTALATFGQVMNAQGARTGEVNDAGATTTVFIVDGFTEATDSHFIGDIIVFTSGACLGQARRITAYTGATQTITVSPALTDAPANNDDFVIIPFARVDLGHINNVAQTATLDDIEAQTDDIGAAGAGLTAIPWNAAWDAEVQSEVTDGLNAYDPPTKAEMDAAHALLATPASILTTALTESYATDGAAATLSQLLYAIQQFLQEKSISGTTMTVKKLDGTTTAMTFTLDSATAPTSVTRAS